MNIKRNYLYNLFNQVLTMILPLITVPYISRVLLPEGVGTFAYTNSIVQYFIIFGMLGINTYGNKMIATTRDNKIEMSKVFFSIYLLQLFLTSLSVIVYFIFIANVLQEYKIIAFLQVIALLSTAVDCSWFFSGIEQFKQIVTRNILIKVVSLLAIFIFVKSQDDLALYTIIMGLSGFLGQLIMWLYVRRFVVRVPVSLGLIVSHLKPTLIYFLPQVAIQIYFVMNKTMLGVFTSSSEVGIYDYADKILKLALSIVTSLGIVMLPRMANIIAKGNLDKARTYITTSLQFSTLIAVPIMFGIAGIANEFIPWYMGKEFYKSIEVLIIISPTIFLMSWSGVFGSQYFVPLGKMKEYTASLSFGAVVNFAANLMLIGSYGSIGAAIGTLCAEIAVISGQLYFLKNEINIKKVLPKTTYYMISGGFMYGVLRILGTLMGSSIITTLVQILAGFISYLFLVTLFELYFKDGLIINEVKKKLADWSLARP